MSRAFPKKSPPDLSPTRRRPSTPRPGISTTQPPPARSSVPMNHGTLQAAWSSRPCARQRASKLFMGSSCAQAPSGHPHPRCLPPGTMRMNSEGKLSEGRGNFGLVIAAGQAGRLAGQWRGRATPRQGKDTRERQQSQAGGSRAWASSRPSSAPEHSSVGQWLPIVPVSPSLSCPFPVQSEPFPCRFPRRAGLQASAGARRGRATGSGARGARYLRGGVPRRRVWVWKPRGRSGHYKLYCCSRDPLEVGSMVWSETARRRVRKARALACQSEVRVEGGRRKDLYRG